MEHGNTQAIKINKTWYELDLFCGDDRILNHTQSLRISTLSISDHRAIEPSRLFYTCLPRPGNPLEPKLFGFKMLRFPIDPARSHLDPFRDFPTKTSMFDDTKTAPWLPPDVDITTVSAAISAIGRGWRESDGIGTGQGGWMAGGWEHHGKKSSVYRSLEWWFKR